MVDRWASRRSGGWMAVLVVSATLLGATSAGASDQFSDVPDDNTFHDDIGWLAETGVTRGCNTRGSAPAIR